LAEGLLSGRDVSKFNFSVRWAVIMSNQFVDTRTLYIPTAFRAP